MWKTVIGWVLFFGGIFVATNTFIRLLTPFHQPHPVESSILLTLAAALIWGGWKLAHRKGGKE